MSCTVAADSRTMNMLSFCSVTEYTETSHVNNIRRDGLVPWAAFTKKAKPPHKFWINNKQLDLILDK